MHRVGLAEMEAGGHRILLGGGGGVSPSPLHSAVSSQCLGLQRLMVKSSSKLVSGVGGASGSPSPLVPSPTGTPKTHPSPSSP